MNAALRPPLHGSARHLAAALTSLAGLCLVTAAIFALDPIAPVLSLGVLYVFAVLPAAVIGGLPYALPVSVICMLAFNWFFLPPLHTFTLADSGNWVALAVYLVTAIVVSELATRSRRQAAEAEQREREASLLAEVSTALLESEHVQDELRGIADRVVHVLGAARGRIEIESLRRPEPSESVHELVVGDRHVGRLFLEAGATPNPEVVGRVLPAVASLLGVAIDRERLARRALETESLRRSDALKTAIVRAVSHDLRSPLTALRTATEALGDDSLALTAADREALVATIQVEAKRLDRLVGNLLDLSRLEVGAAKPRPELWTFDGLAGRALAELGSEAERVDVTLGPDLPPIRVDGTQIERVLVNLLENALKFSSATDHVDLLAESRDGDVVIRVVDRGPGIGEPELERIFEPFERGGGATSSGSGLGLAIARGFALANGGRLWAESAPEAGASFVLSLPASPTPSRVRA